MITIDVMVPLPQLPKCQNCRCAPPCPAQQSLQKVMCPCPMTLPLFWPAPGDLGDDEALTGPESPGLWEKFPQNFQLIETKVKSDDSWSCSAESRAERSSPLKLHFREFCSNICSFTALFKESVMWKAFKWCERDRGRGGDVGFSHLAVCSKNKGFSFSTQIRAVRSECINGT